MTQYFPKAFGSFGRNINVKVDLSSYVTKTVLQKQQALILQFFH